jgi:hypothetical protein
MGVDPEGRNLYSYKSRDLPPQAPTIDFPSPRKQTFFVEFAAVRIAV